MAGLTLYDEAVNRELKALGEWVKERAYDASVDPTELASVLNERLASLRADLEKREAS